MRFILSLGRMTVDCHSFNGPSRMFFPLANVMLDINCLAEKLILVLENHI